MFYSVNCNFMWSGVITRNKDCYAGAKKWFSYTAIKNYYSSYLSCSKHVFVVRLETLSTSVLQVKFHYNSDGAVPPTIGLLLWFFSTSRRNPNLSSTRIFIYICTNMVHFVWNWPKRIYFLVRLSSIFIVICQCKMTLHTSMLSSCSLSITGLEHVSIHTTVLWNLVLFPFK